MRWIASYVALVGITRILGVLRIRTHAAPPLARCLAPLTLRPPPHFLRAHLLLLSAPPAHAFACASLMGVRIHNALSLTLRALLRTAPAMAARPHPRTLAPLDGGRGALAP